MIETVAKFVWDTLGADMASDAYQGVKGALGSYFGILDEKRHSNDEQSFNDNLKLLLSNEALLKQLAGLMEGKNITNSLNNNKDTEMEMALGDNGSIIDSGNGNERSKIKIL